MLVFGGVYYICFFPDVLFAARLQKLKETLASRLKMTDQLVNDLRKYHCRFPPL